MNIIHTNLNQLSLFCVTFLQVQILHEFSSAELILK